MKRKKNQTGAVSAVCQLRGGSIHPFGAMRGFVPLGGGEERVYREMREALPVLDAAVDKMVRLCGGFEVKCCSAQAQEKLNAFLRMMPCGRGQMGIESFLSGYLDSLLTYGRAVGELVVAGGVSANSVLRRRLQKLCAKNGVELYLPSLNLCGDNAAMVGAQGYYELKKGNIANLSLNATASLSIDYN